MVASLLIGLRAIVALSLSKHPHCPARRLNPRRRQQLRYRSPSRLTLFTAKLSTTTEPGCSTSREKHPSARHNSPRHHPCPLRPLCRHHNRKRRQVSPLLPERPLLFRPRRLESPRDPTIPPGPQFYR